jgi:Ca2+-binding RTX toxin-like protein
VFNDDGEDGPAYSYLTFLAADGEANRAWIIDNGDDPGMLVVDAGASLTAVGPECVSLDIHRAACAMSGIPTYEISVGDMSDRVSTQGACGGARTLPADPDAMCGADVDGGDGNDALFGAGSGGISYLLGGAGNDMLDARGLGSGDFASVVNGGPGADRLLGDEVGYWDRVQPVRVTLNGKCDDGEANEHDCVLAASDISTGSGDDVIVADEDANVINTSAGRNVIRAADGRDEIYAGTGKDVVRAGGGLDFVGGDDGPDVIFAGPGRDLVLGAAGSDTFYASDGSTDRIWGGGGTDRARIDRGLDVKRSIERLF